MDEVNRQAESLRGLDADLARLEAKVDALPTKEWIRGAMARAVATTTAAIAAIAAVGTLALYIVVR